MEQWLQKNYLRLGLSIGSIVGVLSILILKSFQGFGIFSGTYLLYFLNPWLLTTVLILGNLGVSGFGGISFPQSMVSTFLGSAHHFGALDKIGNPLLLLVGNIIFWLALGYLLQHLSMKWRAAITCLLFLPALIFLFFY